MIPDSKCKKCGGITEPKSIFEGYMFGEELWSFIYKCIRCGFTEKTKSLDEK